MTDQQSDAGPRGVPATGAGAVVDLIASDPPLVRQSAAADLLEQALAAPRVHRTRVERWVEDPSRFDGGYWEVVT